MVTLRSMTIENFKAIGDPVKIEFKPITLLFGPNSAGKSTIIQALCYAREIFVKGNLDPHRIEVGGEQMDLGGYGAMAHKKKESVTKAISIEIEAELSEKELPSYLADDEIADEVRHAAQIYLRCLDQLHHASVKLRICRDSGASRPYVDYCKISLNGEVFAEIVDILRVRRDASHDGEFLDKPELADLISGLFPNYAHLRVNLEHSLFGDLSSEKPRHLLKEFAKLVLKDPHRLELPPVDSPSSPRGTLLRTSCVALPEWGAPAEFLLLPMKDPDDIDVVEPYPLSQGFHELLSRAIIGPGSLIRDMLSSIFYVGPIRPIPPRYLDLTGLTEEGSTSRKRGVWERLYRANTQVVSAINEWMGPKGLNSGYRIDLNRYRLVDSKYLDDLAANGESKSGDIAAELRKLPEQFAQLSLKQADPEMELSFYDVGTGISQVVPVIFAANVAHNQIVAIEQPELHIHPALQVKLGDLFISRIKEGGCLFLLETHSEHLILRMLRRIRETSENKLPNGAPSLRPDQVNVIYIEPKGGTVRFLPLRIDETGEFIDRWPQGFFEERANELF